MRFGLIIAGLVFAVALVGVASGATEPTTEFIKVWTSGGFLQGVVYDDGYIYVVGADRGGCPPCSEMYVAKLDENGNILWENWEDTGGGAYWDAGNDIVKLGDSLFVIHESGLSGGDAYLHKYNASTGSRIFTKVWSLSGGENWKGIATDGTYLYLAGWTNSYGNGGDDAVVFKYDSNGNQITNINFGGGGDDQFWDIISDGQYLYAVGKTNSWGSGSSDALIAKFYNNGSLIWNITWGGSRDERALSLTSDSQYLYITGVTYSYETNGDAFLLKLSKNGSMIWNITFGGVNFDMGRVVRYTKGAGIFVGLYSNSTNGTAEDAGLVIFDENGNQKWNTSWGGVNREWPGINGIASVRQGRFFNVYFGGMTASYNSPRQAFLIKYTFDAPNITIISPQNTTYGTSTVPINVSATDPSGISTVIAEVDGTANVTLTPSGGYYVGTTPALSDGQHYLRIYANDSFGNVNASEVVYFNISVPRLANSPWPIFMHDLNHTARSPYVGHAEVGIDWCVQLPNKAAKSPIIGNGLIYADTNLNKGLYAIYTNGTQRWNISLGGSTEYASVIASDGTVYEVVKNTSDNYIYLLAIDSASGSIKWKYKTTEITPTGSSPAIGDDGTIYFGAGNSLYAVKPDGTLKWKFTTGGNVRSSPAIASDGTIYVGSADGHLYALNPGGTKKWNVTSFAYGTNAQYFNLPPSIGNDGTIYAIDANGTLYATYPNGTIKWWKYFGSSEASPISIGKDGTVYVVVGNVLYAVDPSNGSEKWNYTVANANSNAAPLVDDNGNIYMQKATGYLVSLYPNGTLRWSFSPSPAAGDPINSIRADVSLVMGNDGTIYTFGTDSSSNNYLCALKDVIPPRVAVISPQNNTLYGTSTITINVSATDPSGINTVIAEIDGTTNVTLNLTNGYYTGTIALSDEQHSVRIYANDTYGNVNVSEVVYFSTRKVTSCTNITQPGYYYLANDIINSTAEVCVLINASDVVLDGRGYTIDGVDDTTNKTKGIYVIETPDVKGHVNVTVKNVTVSDWKYGILLQLSNESAIINVKALSNEYGIYTPGSNNNTIANSSIAGNDIGIWLNMASGNLIYNNLFNNTQNFDLTLVGTNSWNTSLQAGMNIIGGSYIGGNFWALPNGTGYSDTCGDSDGDGICDQPYNLTSGNVDYLPLAKPGAAPPDTTPPGITFVSPTPANGSVLNATSATINVTADERLANATLKIQAWNGSSWGWFSNNTFIAGVVGSYQMYRVTDYNWLGLISNTSTDLYLRYKVEAKDLAGNVNRTEFRYLTIAGYPPVIYTWLYLPYVPQYSTLLNKLYISISEGSPDRLEIYRNGTLYKTLSYHGFEVFNVSIDSSQAGVWNYTLIASDTFGNVNFTSLLIPVTPAEASVEKNITGQKITINETLFNTSTTFEILPEANAGVLRLNVTVSRNVSELDSRTTNDEFAYALASGQGSISKFVKVEVGGDVNAGSLQYAVIAVSYTPEDLDTDGDGSADINESTLTLWRYCGEEDRWIELRHGTNYNVTCGNVTITVFASGVNTSERYVYASLNHLSVFGISGEVIKAAPAVAAAPAPGGAYSPEAVLLANSIDLALAQELVSYLQERGIELHIVNASNFTDYSTKQYIIILGGHRAYEGVGDILAGILSEEEKARIEAGSAYIKKRSVFRSGDVVYIFAGRDRNATREAWLEVYKEVAREIEYNWG